MQSALMALCQYSCACGHQFEQMVESIEQRERTACPLCGSTLKTGLRERVISFHPAEAPETCVTIRGG